MGDAAAGEGHLPLRPQARPLPVPGRGRDPRQRRRPVRPARPRGARLRGPRPARRHAADPAAVRRARPPPDVEPGCFGAPYSVALVASSCSARASVCAVRERRATPTGPSRRTRAGSSLGVPAADSSVRTRSSKVTRSPSPSRDSSPCTRARAASRSRKSDANSSRSPRDRRVASARLRGVTSFAEPNHSVMRPSASNRPTARECTQPVAPSAM